MLFFFALSLSNALTLLVCLLHVGFALICLHLNAIVDKGHTSYQLGLIDDLSNGNLERRVTEADAAFGWSKPLRDATTSAPQWAANQAERWWQRLSLAQRARS